MNEHIFRNYDIRGVVVDDLPAPVVVRLGRAIGTHLLRHGVSSMTLGRDCRLSSPSIRNSLLKGLLATGINVVDIGVCHTPLVYFSLFHVPCEGAVMITGSHNPPECNGFKVCRHATTIFGEEIQALRRLMCDDDFLQGDGRLDEVDLLAAYQDGIAADITVARPLRVVVDAGNGTGGRAAVPLLRRLGCQVIDLFCDMDGRFPNHHPDPTDPATLAGLIEAVRRSGADLGVAYDGDGDRLGVVDETGAIVWGDQLLIIFAREVLARNPGATVIGEVKCSQAMYNDVRARGGRAIMWKTGHSLIKAKMQETGALLAGEMSGHLFFRDRYFGFDDAVYASCRLVEILARSGGALSELLRDVPSTCTTPEIRIACPDADKFDVVARVMKAFRPGYDVIDIDGVRIDMPGGWGLVRASNTEPALVLRFEAATPQRLAEIRSEVEAVVDALLPGGGAA
jgi:phosphomannomutase/phosphoglucomutase